MISSHLPEKTQSVLAQCNIYFHAELAEFWEREATQNLRPVGFPWFCGLTSLNLRFLREILFNNQLFPLDFRHKLHPIRISIIR